MARPLSSETSEGAQQLWEVSSRVANNFVVDRSRSRRWGRWRSGTCKSESLAFFWTQLWSLGSFFSTIMAGIFSWSIKKYRAVQSTTWATESIQRRGRDCGCGCGQQCQGWDWFVWPLGWLLWLVSRKWVELGFTGVVRIFKQFPNVCYKLLFWGYTSTKSNSIGCKIVLRLVIPSSRNRRKGCTYTGLMNNLLFIVKQLDLIPTTATLVLFTNQWNPRMETKRSSPWEITSWHFLRP